MYFTKGMKKPHRLPYLVFVLVFVKRKHGPISPRFCEAKHTDVFTGTQKSQLGSRSLCQHNIKRNILIKVGGGKGQFCPHCRCLISYERERVLSKRRLIILKSISSALVKKQSVVTLMGKTNK